MTYSRNQISLYKKITSALIQKAGLEILPLRMGYSYENQEKIIEFNDDFDNVVMINKYDSMWSPDEHDLEIRQLFILKTPSVLFGKSGVTMPNNKIGLAVRIHSKVSNFQKTLSVGVISNTNKQIEIEFYHRFPISSLRGNLELDFFLYLKESNTSIPQHATKVGMILSDGSIENLIFVIDGEGSAFPMSEFKDKDGPLWRLDNNWIESNIDSFDSSNVNLSLNIAHPLFEQIKGGKTAVSRALMGDILVQSMAMIIQQVVIIEGNSLDDMANALPSSILKAVEYWVSTFDVDISSNFSIMNSLRAYWDRQMIEGDKK